MATPAERQRRHRAHKSGDHRLCDPKRCSEATDSAVTRDVTAAVTRDKPSDQRLNASGRQLWAELRGDDATGDRRVLIVEACRIADRLTGLDRLISGDARDWLSIIESKGDPDRQELVIDKLLAEARQQAVALKAIVAELRAAAAGKPEADQPRKEVSPVADLTARIAARRAGTAG